MPARQDWTQGQGPQCSLGLVLRENLDENVLLELAQDLFPIFPYGFGNLDVHRTSIVFGEGSQRCVLVLRTMMGNSYKTHAIKLRKSFLSLGIRADSVVSSERAAGFMHSLARREVA